MTKDKQHITVVQGLFRDVPRDVSGDCSGLFLGVVITGSYQLCFRGISGVFKWVYGSFRGISAIVFEGISSL